MQILVVLSWLLPLLASAWQAQAGANKEARGGRTIPLEVVSDPQAFSGQEVDLLCWVSLKELDEGRCPAYSEDGKPMGDVKVNIAAVPERERSFVSSHCVNQGVPIRCLVLISGRISVSDDNIPSILEPRLE